MKLHHVGIVTSRDNLWNVAMPLGQISGTGLGYEGMVSAHVPAFECHCYLIGDIEIVVPYGGSLLRWLGERGTSLHHVAFEVQNVRKHAARLREQGVPVLFDEPAVGVAGLLVNFVHFGYTGGVLTEIVEVP